MDPERTYGFKEGALYNRQADIHGMLGGQSQGGMSTPKQFPVVILFTGESGKGHGYDDYWDDDGIFHYVGEGQRGDMVLKAGNQALAQHREDGKAVLLFQALGKSKPYRFIGEFVLLDTYQRDGVLDTDGNTRTVIVFRLKPVDAQPSLESIPDVDPAADLQYPDSDASTTTERTVEVRTKQRLFRRRLERIEKGCRITGLCDARFLRASHIKPWSKCDGNAERVDGNNGLLLAPHVDTLFNDGWISFSDDGRLLVHSELPSEVVAQLGLSIQHGQQCGRPFNANQRRYLAFHREHEYRGA